MDKQTIRDKVRRLMMNDEWRIAIHKVVIFWGGER